MVPIPIDGFDGYFVTAEGRVLSMRPNGGAPTARAVPATPRELRPCTMPKIGYQRVGLMKRGQKRRPTGFLVHRLVALAFIGPPPSATHEARHLDGNPKNNHVSNIAWGTPKENAADKVGHGTVTRLQGEQHPAARLTAEQVAEIRTLVAGGAIYDSVGRVFGVSKATVHAIAAGRLWRHTQKET